jgi:glycosyltransferase involved in cell wall biosynthesis
MVLDVLMSLHLVAKERGLTQSHPATGKLIFYLEKLGLRLPNRLLVENDQYGSYLEQAYKLSRERIRYLPHGADDQVYRPRHAVTSDQLFRVVYHGSFVPSHGLDTVVKAARLLACHPEIQFDLYGTGPESAAIELEASIPSHRNMHFHGYVDTEQLLDGISRAGVCLGVFGDTKQSLCTVQNKIWEGMAMAVAVISGRPGIVESVLQHREHIYLVERCDPEALASGILELKNNPELRRSIASKGYQFFMQGHSTLALGAKAEELLLDVLSSNRQNPKTVESS